MTASANRATVGSHVIPAGDHFNKYKKILTEKFSYKLLVGLNVFSIKVLGELNSASGDSATPSSCGLLGRLSLESASSAKKQKGNIALWA